MFACLYLMTTVCVLTRNHANNKSSPMKTRGFLLPRNSLGKGFRDLGGDMILGGKFDFTFSRGHVVHSEDPPQFETGMIV